MWPTVSLGLLLALNAAFTPGFYLLAVRDGRVYGVLVDILNHGSRTGIVAIGMTLVVATGGVDLSVGAAAAIAGAVMAVLLAHGGVPWPAAVGAALAAGLVCGVWNGVLVTVLRLQPIVATLILMVAGRGIAQLVTDGLVVTFESPAVASIGNGALLGLPSPVTVLALVVAAVGVVVRWTRFGLAVEAMGDNELAARYAGVPGRLVKGCVYGTCGLFAGLAGVIECSYIKAADANNAGNLLELDAILAVVIGGTALRGGRFSLCGTVVGAMLMQSLTTTLYMRNVSAEVAPAPKAAVVIVVCLLQSERFRAWAGALGRGRGGR